MGSLSACISPLEVTLQNDSLICSENPKPQTVDLGLYRGFPSSLHSTKSAALSGLVCVCDNHPEDRLTCSRQLDALSSCPRALSAIAVHANHKLTRGLSFQAERFPCRHVVYSQERRSDLATQFNDTQWPDNTAWPCWCTEHGDGRTITFGWNDLPPGRNARGFKIQWRVHRPCQCSDLSAWSRLHTQSQPPTCLADTTNQLFLVGGGHDKSFDPSANSRSTTASKHDGNSGISSHGQWLLR